MTIRSHTRSFAIAIAVVAFAASFVVAAHAQSVSHSAAASRVGDAAAGGRRGIATDGQGNVDAAAGSGFVTANGVRGQRSVRYTRSSDGTASAERNTTATNPNTGVTFDGSTTYTKGSGASRNASCTDASGNAVNCGKSR
jgi:hypothetical protein